MLRALVFIRKSFQYFSKNKTCIYNWLLLNSLQVISRKYGRSL